MLKQINEVLDNGRAMAWARIVRQIGSSPRAAGVGCLVMDDGAVIGTIGGGRVEYEVTKKAVENFAARRPFWLHLELTGAEASTKKMICGGVVDVYTEYLVPENEAVCSFFHRLGNQLREGKRGVLLTLLTEEDDSSERHVFLGQDGALIGEIRGLVPEEEQKTRWLEANETALGEVAGVGRIFVQPMEPEDVLYLFGAGHVSACLAPVAKMIGFHVSVIDDREELCHRGRFPQADELMVLSYTEAFDRIVVSPFSYLVIVTRGHIHDLKVLRAALRKSPAYIGMIGSKSKIASLYKILLQEGVSGEDLQNVHAPIGLDIGAESPAEIAVGIAAELIQVRAARRQSA